MCARMFIIDREGRRRIGEEDIDVTTRERSIELVGRIESGEAFDIVGRVCNVSGE